MYCMDSPVRESRRGERICTGQLTGNGYKELT